MFSTTKYSLLLLLCCLFLSACSFVSPKTTTNLHYLSWQQRQEELSTIKSWSIQGSLGITYNGKTDIVSFEWLNTDKNYTIDIHSPLNLASVHIVGDSHQVTLWKSGKRRMTAATAEELMQDQLGWSLPISSLVYWIRALPSPSSPIELQALDEYNHLIQLQQNGWTIQYLSFMPVDEVDLPTKMVVQSSQVRCKIAIKKWSTI
jgi:outer membrane lipoprotein LolB